ncbi:hypothetical protein HN958_02610 [Candidatus Falkowbacteria bacterium]|jgi:hypothetical protein|nr:hypothetical protein [Candidatus Falkowbacteria bacterium]
MTSKSSKKSAPGLLLAFTIVGHRVLKRIINAVHRAGGDDAVIAGLLKKPRLIEKIAGLIMEHGQYKKFPSITHCPELIPRGSKIKKDVPEGKFQDITYIFLNEPRGEIREKELKQHLETYSAHLGLSDAARIIGKGKKGTSFLDHTRAGWILIFPGTVVTNADNIPCIPVIRCLRGKRFSISFEPLNIDRNDGLHYLVRPKVV